MDCSVCVSKLNKTNRKNVVCNYCEYSACRECYHTYITGQSQDAQCMSCKKPFSRDFLTDNFTSTFINTTLKKHRENLLFDREKSLLPATQPYVILEKEKAMLQDVVSNLYQERALLLAQVQQRDFRIDEIQRQIRTMTVDNMQTPVEERRKFVRKCPMENCRGFLSTQWKCGVCETKICNLCNENKEENHVCLPDNVASMELLNKDTKPCPKCGVLIFKISGCSQMFCVDCHTPWDWNTGKIYSGTIHNPHYYEFMRRGGQLNREHGDIPCGGLPNIREFNRKLYLIPDNLRTNFYYCHNVVTHLQHVEIRPIPNHNDESNRSLRVKYLMGTITEEGFKSTLQINEKKRAKLQDFNNIYQMFVDVCSDIFRQIMLSKDAGFIINQISVSNNLREYFNEQCKKLSKNYKCVSPGITHDYRFVSNIDTYHQRINQNV